MIYQEIVCESLNGNAFLPYNKPDYTCLAGSIRHVLSPVFLSFILLSISDIFCLVCSEKSAPIIQS